MTEGKLASVFKNALTAAPYTIYQGAILGSVVSGDPKYVFFALLAIVMGDGFNAVEKVIAKKLMGKTSAVGARPSGCGIAKGVQCTGCGIYPACGKSSHTWGMPSGHAQITSFAATYWTIYVWMRCKTAGTKDKKKLRIQAIVATLIMWSLSVMVWSQRVYSGCHTALQIIIGALLGSALGVGGYYVSTLVFPANSLPKLAL